LKSNFRWNICALLFFATTINHIDRQILALIRPILDGQFRCANTRFSSTNSAAQGFPAL
jgi:ACS family hexuronate transporter-like MFS transporter